MPTYDFKCHTCEHTFTEFATMEERESIVNGPCPECGTFDIRQKLTSLNIKYGLTNRNDENFRQRMKEIKRANPRNNIPDY